MASQENTRCCNVKPGIYRTVIGSPHGPPGLEKHLQWCKVNRRAPDLQPIGEEIERILCAQDLFLSREFPEPYYIEDPQSFFGIWKAGYDGSNGIRLNADGAKGFELQYVSWNQRDPYYNVGSWEGLDESGTLNSIVIATDLNGIVDIGWMALGVNEFDRKQVLTYKPREKISGINQAKWRENSFLLEEDIYHPSPKIMEFPFSSINPCKTESYTWTLIGISPHEIYDSLMNIGFILPESLS